MNNIKDNVVKLNENIVTMLKISMEVIEICLMVCGAGYIYTLFNVTSEELVNMYQEIAYNEDIIFKSQNVITILLEAVILLFFLTFSSLKTKKEKRYIFIYFLIIAIGHIVAYQIRDISFLYLFIIEITAILFFLHILIIVVIAIIKKREGEK